MKLGFYFQYFRGLRRYGRREQEARPRGEAWDALAGFAYPTEQFDDLEEEEGREDDIGGDEEEEEEASRAGRLDAPAAEGEGEEEEGEGEGEEAKEGSDLRPQQEREGLCPPQQAADRAAPRADHVPQGK